jgi:hypothetical protein
MLLHKPPIGSQVLRLGEHSSSRFHPGGVYTITVYEDRYASFIGDNGELHSIYNSYYDRYELIGTDHTLTNIDFKHLLKESDDYARKS